ncbi:MAG: hypothetical protein RSA20_05860 [Oscillospiraceae bacterium]
MKTFKILWAILLLLLLSACNECGDKRIVKLLSVTEREISAVCYSYKEEKGQYETISVKNEGIQDTLLKILEGDSYDLKLCQTCIVDEKIAQNQASEVFAALNSAKFTPDISVVCAQDFSNMEKYLEKPAIKNHIYNWRLNQEKVSATIPIIEQGEGTIVILDGEAKGIAGEGQTTLLNILTGKTGSESYNFNYEGREYSAILENISTYYGKKNGGLCVSITAKLAVYRGMSGGKENRKKFIELVKWDMEKEIMNIYKSADMTRRYNLRWYEKVDPRLEGSDVEIKINIL